MIKAFLFDYDGVYTPGARNDWVFSRLAENLNISFETSASWSEKIWVPFIKGVMTEDEVWEYFESQYGSPIPIEKRDIWFRWDELTPHPDMVETVQSLKADGYVVGVLSNIFPNNKATIQANGGYDGFDVVVTSCDLGFKKPQREIFEYSLSQLPGIQPAEVVFLDDREDNARACEELGMKGIYVKDHGEAIADIKALIAQQ
jgi:epoxide hydrolase-like predicted phosphatase